MHTDLTLFRLATAKAEHAAGRQTVVAQNLANADTPGYKARDLPPFSEVLDAASPASEMRAIHPAHYKMGFSGSLPDARAQELPGNEAPNGNSVSIETEMIRASEIRHNHDMALTVYHSGLKLLRAAVGN